MDEKKIANFDPNCEWVVVFFGEYRDIGRIADFLRKKISFTNLLWITHMSVGCAIFIFYSFEREREWEKEQITFSICNCVECMNKAGIECIFLDTRSTTTYVQNSSVCDLSSWVELW